MSGTAPHLGSLVQLRPEPDPTPADAVPASVGSRLLANLIDAVIITVPSTVVVVLVLVLSSISDSAGLVASLLYLLLLAAVLAYAVLYNGRGGTIGKRLMGVRVVDVDTGAWIGPARAFVRWLVLGVEALPCYLGYLSPFLDRTGQLRGWHDLAARDRCVVVARERLTQALLP